MIVFDVVQIISLGALTSTPAGRWHTGIMGVVRVGRSMDDARNLAKEAVEHFKRCRGIDGIDYVVEVHDELCMGRAREVRERDWMDVECNCTSPTALE
jgi:hypothetical protein